MKNIDKTNLSCSGSPVLSVCPSMAQSVKHPACRRCCALQHSPAQPVCPRPGLASAAHWGWHPTAAPGQGWAQLPQAMATSNEEPGRMDWLGAARADSFLLQTARTHEEWQPVFSVEILCS